MLKSITRLLGRQHAVDVARLVFCTVFDIYSFDNYLPSDYYLLPCGG